MEKNCKQCGETKPLDGFYRNRKSEDGRDFYCKACRQGQGAALRAKRRESRPSKPERTGKRCGRCEQEKPFSEFYRSPTNGKYSWLCRPCNTEQHREYVQQPEVAARVLQQQRNRAEGKWKRPPRRQPIAEGYEVCTSCNLDKPVDEFHKHKLGRNGVNNICKVCAAALARERRQDPAIREREAHQKAERIFKMPPGRYAEMLAEQGGVCAICRKVRPNGRRLHVDHCHESGAVRGLLCYSCNTGLGAFRDNPDVMVAAIEYLQTHKES